MQFSPSKAARTTLLFVASSLLIVVTASAGASAYAQAAATAPNDQTAQSEVSPSPAVPATDQLAHVQQMLEKGEYQEAGKQLDVLRAQNPEPAGVERTLGNLYYAQGQMAPADAAYAKAVEQDPQDHSSAQMRGMTLFRMGKPADAIPFLQKANGWLANINADANYVLALAYMQTKQYDQARKAFAAVYGFPPESANSYLLSARMLLRQEFTPAAQQYAHRALELQPNILRAHELLGEIALSQQDLDTALAEFQKELELDPLNSSVYDRLGDTYLRQQKYDDAQKSLNRAILLDPYSSGPLVLLGKTLLRRSDPVMASSFLVRAVHMDPGNYMAHNLLGQAYRALGRPEEAKRELQTAERLQRSPGEQEAGQGK